LSGLFINSLALTIDGITGGIILIRKSLILIFAVFLTAGCSKTENTNSGVYQTVFNQYSKENKTYFVRETIAEIKKEYLGEKELDYWLSYKQTSVEKKHSTKDLGMSNVKFVTDVNFDKIFFEGCTKGRNRFHFTYPDADVLISLSKVGYRNDDKEAVVYIEVSSGCLSATGSVIFLEKDKGEWQVIHEAELWKS